MVVGGTVGRGGGPTAKPSHLNHSSLLGYPKSAEQGEVIGNKYGNKDAAYYNLEMLVSAAINHYDYKEEEWYQYVKSLRSHHGPKWWAVVDVYSVWSLEMNISIISLNQVQSRLFQKASSVRVQQLVRYHWNCVLFMRSSSWSQSRVMFLSGAVGSKALGYRSRSERI